MAASVPAASSILASLAPGKASDLLEDPVQRTCSGACALRALELLRRPDDALIRDTLALRMAGAQQLHDYGVRWDAWEAAEGPGKHSYFAGRARVLDELVEEAAADCAKLSSAGGGGGADGGSIRVQVASIGCGMDTRPWRIRLPPGTAWYDVDQEPVVVLKERFLRDAGAELEPPQQAPPGAGGEGPFPLKCALYKQVVADLEEPGLQQQLEAAGFSASIPTIFVIEGVLYYITAGATERVLRAAAAASPKGSRLVATHIPKENLEANRASPPSSHLAQLFTTCVEEMVASGVLGATGWGGAAVSGDVSEVVRDRCGGVECYYPYSLAYSGGVKLPRIEHVVTAVRTSLPDAGSGANLPAGNGVPR